MPLLRPVSDGDVADVLALNERNVALLAPLDEPRLRELQGWADRFDVVEDDGEFAGFVLTFRAGTPYDSENYAWFTERHGDRFYYLDRIVLHEGHRRRGLGGFVYDEVEHLARPFGRLALEVNVVPPNHGSLAFHAGRGFSEVGRLGDDAHTVALMEKDL
jgi:uncharacterized protein